MVRRAPAVWLGSQMLLTLQPHGTLSTTESSPASGFSRYVKTGSKAATASFAKVGVSRVARKAICAILSLVGHFCLLSFLVVREIREKWPAALPKRWQPSPSYRQNVTRLGWDALAEFDNNGSERGYPRDSPGETILQSLWMLALDFGFRRFLPLAWLPLDSSQARDFDSCGDALGFLGGAGLPSECLT